MIRRGKAEGWLQLPPEALLPWAMLNEVSFDRVVPGVSENKGAALLAKDDLTASNDDGEPTVLLTVPQELILSWERVGQHAKIDKDLREVLESLGESARVGPSPAFVICRSRGSSYIAKAPISFVMLSLSLSAIR